MDKRADTNEQILHQWREEHDVVVLWITVMYYAAATGMCESSVCVNGQGCYAGAS